MAITGSAAGADVETRVADGRYADAGRVEVAGGGVADGAGAAGALPNIKIAAPAMTTTAARTIQTATGVLRRCIMGAALAGAIKGTSFTSGAEGWEGGL